MRLFKALLASSMLTFLVSPVSADVVEVNSGKLKGTSSNGIDSFLGIPYAAPPVGENRWRAPKPVKPWSGIREALSFGSDCVQPISRPNILPGIQTTPSEDCLFLNVWRPSEAKEGANLPVMVWVHGGGLFNGGSSFPVYSGENFARDGIVFVSINYRLNRFGFFAHPALADEGFGGNFGFLDQIAALTWVRDNIAAFGGDPEHVTIFGESAGGRSMHMLLQSPLARGLFDAVIIQSGGGRSQPFPMSGVGGAAAIGWDYAATLSADELRAIPADKVLENINLLKTGVSDWSGPMNDGKTLLGPDNLDIAEARLYADVPMMIGSNSADAILFAKPYKERLLKGFGEMESEARAIHDPNGTKTDLEVGVTIGAAEFYQEQARAISRELASQGKSVWVYRFDHNGTQSGVKMGGVPHAAEIPYVFDLEELRLQQLDTGRDAEVAALTHAYWVNFAKYFDPNGEGLPNWPKTDGQSTKVQLIGTDKTQHVEDPQTNALDLRERQLQNMKR